MNNTMNASPAMVVIPRGEIPSTKSAAYLANYSGQHVESFEIGKYVVTLAEWLDVMDYLPPDSDIQSHQHPVVNVNWYDVHLYIDKLNERTGKKYRLPSELEWEYAARAGTSNDYHVSRNTAINGSVINLDKRNQGTVAVGSLPPNVWGCYEMLGNVWEWVSDGGRMVACIEDGTGYELGLLRGGCWASSEFEVTLTARDEHEKETSGWNSFGFRLARDL